MDKALPPPQPPTSDLVCAAGAVDAADTADTADRADAVGATDRPLARRVKNPATRCQPDQLPNSVQAEPANEDFPDPNSCQNSAFWAVEVAAFLATLPNEPPAESDKAAA